MLGEKFGCKYPEFNQAYLGLNCFSKIRVVLGLMALTWRPLETKFTRVVFPSGLLLKRGYLKLGRIIHGYARDGAISGNGAIQSIEIMPISTSLPQMALMRSV